MDSNSHAVLLLLLLLLLLLPPLPLHASQCRTSYRPTNLCPTEDSLALDGPSTEQECAMACGRSERCDVFHFRKSDRRCFHGNGTCTGMRMWSAGDCKAFRQIYPKPAIVDKLSLAILYKFGSIGSAENLAATSITTMTTAAASSSSAYTLTSANVTFDCNGANFVENATDLKLGTRSDGFYKLLDYNRSYALFVQLRTNLSPEIPSLTTHSVHDCYSNNEANSFAIANGKLLQFNAWPNGMSQGTYSPTMLPTSTRYSTLFNLGVTFNASAQAKFYFNGTLEGQAGVIGPTAIDLGYNPYSRYGCLSLKMLASDTNRIVNGSHLCFALAGRQFALQDFKELEDWCLE